MKFVCGIAVMTKGGEGVSVSDGKYLYSACQTLTEKLLTQPEPEIHLQLDFYLNL